MGYETEDSKYTKMDFGIEFILWIFLYFIRKFGMWIFLWRSG